MGRLCFPDAVQIVDFYNALEHTGEVVETLLGRKEHPEDKARLRRWAKRLLRNGVSGLITQSRQEARQRRSTAAVEEALGYFVNSVPRMQYVMFRAQGLFIDSGVIEAGCKTLIGSRRKQSGMFWSVPGGENILAFRCIHASRRLEAFWKTRFDQHAARNDALPLAA